MNIKFKNRDEIENKIIIHEQYKTAQIYSSVVSID
jgi:hypothetical protein